MELKFDNEIDALLRKDAGARAITIGEFASPHMDADEIAAFAENAVPDSAKLNYTAHFADCERCKKTLSSVIQLNSQAEFETASSVSAPAEAEKALPWYRKLFLFPNLAYVMGGLVLLFSGFFAFSVLKNSKEKSAISDVSQVKTDEARVGGPNPRYGETYSTSNQSPANAMSSNAASSNANSQINAANTMANAAPAKNPVFAAKIAPETTDSKRSSPSFTLDGVDSGGAAAPAPPAKQPKPIDRPVRMADKNDLSKSEDRRKTREQEVSKEKDELKVMGRATTDLSAAPKTMRGPSRNEQQQQQKRNDAQMRKNEPAAKKAAKPEGSMASDRKQVAGKTFEFKQGVWYDSTYRGQATTNVRRGTDNYRKLDSGLRTIAEGIIGTVVTLWKEKAYRID